MVLYKGHFSKVPDNLKALSNNCSENDKRVEYLNLLRLHFETSTVRVQNRRPFAYTVKPLRNGQLWENKKMSSIGRYPSVRPGRTRTIFIFRDQIC